MTDRPSASGPDHDPQFDWFAPPPSRRLIDDGASVDTSRDLVVIPGPEGSGTSPGASDEGQGDGGRTSQPRAGLDLTPDAPPPVQGASEASAPVAPASPPTGRASVTPSSVARPEPAPVQPMAPSVPSGGVHGQGANGNGSATGSLNGSANGSVLGNGNGNGNGSPNGSFNGNGSGSGSASVVDNGSGSGAVPGSFNGNGSGTVPDVDGSAHSGRPSSAPDGGLFLPPGGVPPSTPPTRSTERASLPIVHPTPGQRHEYATITRLQATLAMAGRTQRSTNGGLPEPAHVLTRGGAPVYLAFAHQSNAVLQTLRRAGPVQVDITSTVPVWTDGPVPGAPRERVVLGNEEHRHAEAILLRNEMTRLADGVPLNEHSVLPPRPPGSRPALGLAHLHRHLGPRPEWWGHFAVFTDAKRQAAFGAIRSALAGLSNTNAAVLRMRTGESSGVLDTGGQYGAAAFLARANKNADRFSTYWNSPNGKNVSHRLGILTRLTTGIALGVATLTLPFVAGMAAAVCVGIFTGPAALYLAGRGTLAFSRLARVGAYKLTAHGLIKVSEQKTQREEERVHTHSQSQVHEVASGIQQPGNDIGPEAVVRLPPGPLPASLQEAQGQIIREYVIANRVFFNEVLRDATVVSDTPAGRTQQRVDELPVNEQNEMKERLAHGLFLSVDPRNSFSRLKALEATRWTSLGLDDSGSAMHLGISPETGNRLQATLSPTTVSQELVR